MASPLDIAIERVRSQPTFRLCSSPSAIAAYATSPLHLTTPAAVVNLIAGDVFSTGDLILTNCKKLGKVTATGNIIVVDCPDIEQLTAGKDLHIYNSQCQGERVAHGSIYFHYHSSNEEEIYTNSQCSDDLVTKAPVVRLRNTKVGGTIRFQRDGDPHFTGKVILEGASTIGRPELVNGTIESIMMQRLKRIKSFQNLLPKNAVKVAIGCLLYKGWKLLSK